MCRAALVILFAVALSASFCGSALADLTPKEQVGKLLFFDTNLSTPAGQACAACHGPETGFVGPISEINAHGAVYPGAVHTRFGNRKPPTAAYASFSPDFHYDEAEGLYVGGMFWDGRALNVVEQAKGPFLNPLEQNNPNKKQVVNKVRLSGYARAFQEVYGYGIFFDIEAAYNDIADAIAAYEASNEVNRFTSKYDYYLAGMVDLSEQEMRGLALFSGQANCAACHPSEPGPYAAAPLFTDYTYDNLGVPKNPENPFYDMPPYFNPDGQDYVDYGLGGILGAPEETGKFKVPTLRNVGMRPYEGFVQAYGHNGSFKSLHEIVDFYNTRDLGGWPDPEVPENVNHDELGNLGLSAEDVDDIVAFLNTLTDGYELAPPRQEAAPLPEDASIVLNPDILRAYPNPFRATAGIEFRLRQGGPVRATIHDPSGRLVRTLVGGEIIAAGVTRLVWDGTDEHGWPAAPGIYLYKLSTAEGTRTGKILRSR